MWRHGQMNQHSNNEESPQTLRLILTMKPSPGSGRGQAGVWLTNVGTVSSDVSVCGLQGPGRWPVTSHRSEPFVSLSLRAQTPGRISHLITRCWLKCHDLLGYIQQCMHRIPEPANKLSLHFINKTWNCNIWPELTSQTLRSWRYEGGKLKQKYF